MWSGRASRNVSNRSGRSGIPEFDVASPGITIEEARRNPAEALEWSFEGASPREIEQRRLVEVYMAQVEAAMGRLAVPPGRAVCEILACRGFGEVRRPGSHIVMQRQDDEGTTTAPAPDHEGVAAGRLRAIIRQSGLPRGEFETA